MLTAIGLSALGAPCEQVRGRGSGIQQLTCAFRAHHGQRSCVEQSYLHQDGGLVPVDVLGGYLAVLELHDPHRGDLDSLAGGGTPGSIQSICVVWVKLSIISSTTRSSPTVRERKATCVYGGFLGIKCSE